MNRYLFYLAAAVCLLTASCGNKNKAEEKQTDTTNENVGDSTLYGLACEGCTDSVLVFLSFNGGDPVTFDIIEAVRNKKVIGHPETGDWVGVVLNANDKKKADMVIDLDQLKGRWVYMAMPERNKEYSALTEKQFDTEAADSMFNRLMVPREQGFALKRSHLAEPIGSHFKRNDMKKDPVVYPEVKFYSEWYINNGKLLLVALNPLSKQKDKANITARDTAEFIFMMKDSLQLKFKDGIRSYYRK